MAAVDDEQTYERVVQSAMHWNARLMAERKMRQPYLDNTTGLAQSNCSLWMRPQDRKPGVWEGQIYSYPSRRWRKKKRECTALTNILPVVDLRAHVTAPTSVVQIQDSTVENNKESWFGGYEEFEENVEFDDFEDGFEDDSDYDEATARKRRKKGGASSTGTSRTRTRTRNEETEKPFACDLCSARYKTKPGLTYHMSHFHGAEPEGPAHEELSRPDETDAVEMTRNGKAGGNRVPNDYCDFCLGDSSMNKKTKHPEEMVSCSDCGRSGHPSCLQFTENMKVSVRKYHWQCIECKSCGLCGTSENDDQLLFCDDCDRGYHMYCLTPPLASPPEGNWSCHLCIQEFHHGLKPHWMKMD